MKHFKLFFALFAMLALGVGNAWAETIFSDNFANVGTGSSTSISSRTGWTGFTKCYCQYNSGVRLGTGSATGSITKTAMTNIEGSTTLTVTFYLAKYNSDSGKMNITVSGGGTASTTTFTPAGNAGVTSTSSKATWTDTYKCTFTIENATSATTIKFATSSKRLILGPVTISTPDAAPDEPGTPTPSVSVSPASHTFATTNVGETATQVFEITAENTTETLSAEISNTTDYAISAIADNKITVTYQPQTAETHEATLTIKAGDEASATVTLSGKAVAALEGTWALVTDASSLKAGDEIIIAAKDYDVALSTTQNNNNRGEIAITKNGNLITATSEVQVLTLQAGKKENTLALYTGAGYLHAASSGSNHLKTETTLSDNSSWTISIANGTATLTAQGTYTRNTMFYNQSSKIFACYASNTTTQKAIAIYKNTNGQQLAGLAYATTKYLTKLGDAFATPALTNPNSLAVTYSSSDNNVATVAADGAVTIKATGVVKITASFAGNSSFLEGSASYTIGVTEHAGTQADPYSVADARRVIDAMEIAEGVYAKGLVSEIVTAYNSTYGNISYNISADGLTTSDQLQAYRGKSYDGANFTSADDVKVGDEVVIKGTLKKFSTTYEFDADNQLVSLNRTKEQAGLAYAETEHTANVGEDFAEPALTNPNNLTVTYSSSNTTVATVNATTGEVTILAAGKVTITASTSGNASYSAGSASYNITITNPGLAVATLPFAFNGNKAAIETTAGMTQNGLGSDYSASTAPNSQLKFDGTDDWVVIHFDSEPGQLSYEIKGNSFSGGKFTVQQSADGSAYTEVVTHTELGDAATKEHVLAAESRYVKFIYTEKSSGNVGLGNIKITKFGEEPEQPGEGGGETPEERLTDWVLTPLADITTNDLVVITMTKGETTWAMTNDKGTTAAPVASVVTLSADALAAEPDANLKWVVSNNNGTLTIYPYGGYETWLYCTNTNNGVRVGDGDAKEFTLNANYLYTSQTSDPRHIGIYNNADWRCYKPSDDAIHTNIAGQTLAFYVKKNANDVLPGTGEDPEGGEGGEDPVVPTINPTATFIFNTAEGLNDLGIAYPTTEDEDNAGAYKTNLTDGASFTQDGITMTSTDGTTVTRVWLTAAGKLDLRVYKNATLTFSVPENLQITTIAFNGSNIDHLLVDGVEVKNNTWTGSKKEITFTAKEGASTIKINTIAFVVEYTRDVTYGNYGTICLPYGSNNYSGAEFYEVSSLEVGKGLWLDKLAASTALAAGKPYIFKATDSKITVAYEGEKKDTPVDGENGLIGTFTDIAANTDLVGHYIIADNKIWIANDQNTLPANRAYIANTVPTTEQPQLPGRRRVCMGENATTGFNQIVAPEGKAVKVIENGQLIIIRDGVKYNVQGVRL